MAHPFRIRFHPRSKRIKLKLLRDASLEVVAPPGTSERLIRRFVEASGDWVDRARERLPVRRAAGPGVGPFPEVLALRALDQFAPVQYEESPRPVWRWQAPQSMGKAGPELTIGLPDREPAAAQSVLVAALKARARQHLEPRFHALAGQLDKTVVRLTWRNQKTRWGSCSSRGAISLNIRLLFLPPELVGYVFAHELTHLDHPDHSARFWNALETTWPGAREHRRAIRNADELLPEWIVR